MSFVGSKLGLSDVQAELDRISSRETDSDLSNANDAPATDGQDTWRSTHSIPAPLLSPLLSTSLCSPPLTSIIKMLGKQRGGHAFIPHRLFTFSLRRTRRFLPPCLPSSTPLFSLCGCYTKEKYLSLLHARLLLHASTCKRTRTIGGNGKTQEVNWRKMTARMKVRVFCPSIDCDGTVSVYTVERMFEETALR